MQDMTDRNGRQPTDEGRLRYPPDGYYDRDACTCAPECPSPCQGIAGDTNCGCYACTQAFEDAYEASFQEPDTQ